MEKKIKLLKCWKCGSIIEVNSSDASTWPRVCTMPMPCRTSGICGGSYVLATKQPRMNDEDTIDNYPCSTARKIDNIE